jgi:hypothetical protein
MLLSDSAHSCSSVVIRKDDSNASTRIWEKLIKPGELPDGS